MRHETFCELWVNFEEEKIFWLQLKVENFILEAVISEVSDALEIWYNKTHQYLEANDKNTNNKSTQ